MRTVILVVRHAEVHNPKDIVYGRLPGFRLSAHGREQAAVTARFVASRSVDAIYTSPLLRARQTAQILARHQDGVAVKESKRLLEVKTGFQGSPNSILRPGFSFYEPRVRMDDEAMQDVLDRMLAQIHQLVRLHAGSTVAMVSHGDPIAILRVGLEGRPLTVANLHSTVYPARASVTQVVVNHQPLPDLSYFDLAGEGSG